MEGEGRGLKGKGRADRYLFVYVCLTESVCACLTERLSVCVCDGGSVCVCVTEGV
jgi:hypothetical protein